MPRRDKIEGFERGDEPSDGDIACDSITSDGHTIRKGSVVFWKLSNVEYDEWRPCCRKHAIAEANIVY